MKIAVFGGTGFVGSYIIDELLNNGHEPVVLVRKGKNKSIYYVNSTPNGIQYVVVTVTPTVV